MTIPFGEFPACYRYCQTVIGFAMLAFAVAGPILRVVPIQLRFFVLCALGLIVFSALVLSHYVIVKYPYISLVETENPDPFSQHFASHGSMLYKILKVVGLITPATIAVAIAVSGFGNLLKTFLFVYCVVLTFFMLFFTFKYEPTKHPTVSTFVRSTLGLGIIFYPIYSISILVGAIRCKRLLEVATD